MRSKLEVVTGFLGAGKTAFINTYLNTEICKSQRILVVQLEMGRSDVETRGDSIKVINIKNNFNINEEISKELKNRYYNRVIVECNGTESLEVIENLLKEKDIKKNIEFYGNYYVGDSKTLKLYISNMGELIIPFIQSSKLIVLNNLGFLDTNEKNTVIEMVGSINGSAPIIEVNNLEELKVKIYDSKFFKVSRFENIISIFLERYRRI